MAVPTYDELLARFDIKGSAMKLTFDDKYLRQFSLTLDTWEKLARFLEIPSPDIANIKRQGDVEEQKDRMLECWKQRCGSMATYETMVKALLKISRTDLAEKVARLRLPERDAPMLRATTSQVQKSMNLATPSSGETDKSSSLAATLPSTLQANTRELTAQEVISTLQTLEEEFYDLVIYIEDTLANSKICLNTITRRFSMLPQSVRRRHETDESYKEIRRRILESETIKKLFDNLTELKHWNYMTPDTLAHIVKDVKIDDVHKKIKVYEKKLMDFKARTKLKELLGISFPVPDYCMELTMEVEGWEDKTIQEVENSVVNIMRRVTHQGGQNIDLGWKGVNIGSVKLMFILKESVKFTSVETSQIYEDSGVVSIQVDKENIFHEDQTEVY